MAAHPRHKHTSADGYLDEAKQLAIQRGGVYLSGEYLGCRSKLVFRCADGHDFETTVIRLRAGQWCPRCRYPTEGIVRLFLETVFGKKFSAESPTWLRGSEFGICKLDGFCKELKLAFEYHGSQHRTYVDHFHKEGRRRSLAQQMARDEYVRQKCHENGVRLIEVEFLRYVTPSSFEKHMVETLRTYGLTVSDEAITAFRGLPFMPSKLAEMRALAKSRGGECLSTKYVTSLDKLHWKCALGHEWYAKASNVQHKGYWCPECSGWNAAHQKKLDPLADLRDIALDKGGRLLSTEYQNNRTKLELECSAGHRWQAEPWTIRRDHWCPVCTKKRLINPLEELHQLANAKGGEFLGISYTNNRLRQPFRCTAGHEFSLKPADLKHRRMWCPICLRDK